LVGRKRCYLCVIVNTTDLTLTETTTIAIAEIPLIVVAIGIYRVTLKDYLAIPTWVLKHNPTPRMAPSLTTDSDANRPFERVLLGRLSHVENIASAIKAPGAGTR
jgi:hypothetical protein